jgi:hypothetical protein
VSSSGHEFIAGSRVRRNIGVLANLPANCSADTRYYPLLFHAPHRRNSRISAPMTMSRADNLLQKQQKQREQGCCGNPALHSAEVEMDRGLGAGACQQVMRFSKSPRAKARWRHRIRAGVTTYG